MKNTLNILLFLLAGTLVSDNCDAFRHRYGVQKRATPNMKNDVTKQGSQGLKVQEDVVLNQGEGGSKGGQSLSGERVLSLKEIVKKIRNTDRLNGNGVLVVSKGLVDSMSTWNKFDAEKIELLKGFYIAMLNAINSNEIYSGYLKLMLSYLSSANENSLEKTDFMLPGKQKGNINLNVNVKIGDQTKSFKVKMSVPYLCKLFRNVAQEDCKNIQVSSLLIGKMLGRAGLDDGNKCDITFVVNDPNTQFARLCKGLVNVIEFSQPLMIADKKDDPFISLEDAFKAFISRMNQKKKEDEELRKKRELAEFFGYNLDEPYVEKRNVLLELFGNGQFDEIHQGDPFYDFTKDGSGNDLQKSNEVIPDYEDDEQPGWLIPLN